MKLVLGRARSCCLGLLPNYYQKSRLAVIVIDHSATHSPDDVGPLSLDALVALLGPPASSASLLRQHTFNSIYYPSGLRKRD